MKELLLHRVQCCKYMAEEFANARCVSFPVLLVHVSSFCCEDLGGKITKSAFYLFGGLLVGHIGRVYYCLGLALTVKVLEYFNDGKGLRS